MEANIFWEINPPIEIPNEVYNKWVDDYIQKEEYYKSLNRNKCENANYKM